MGPVSSYLANESRAAWPQAEPAYLANPTRQDTCMPPHNAQLASLASKIKSLPDYPQGVTVEQGYALAEYIKAVGEDPLVTPELQELLTERIAAIDKSLEGVTAAGGVGARGAGSILAL